VITEENVIKLNKVILASFTILCLLSVPLMMEGNISVKAESKIWYVYYGNVSGPWNGTKEYPYQNITDALEHALDGHTVFVYNGTYCENIVVDKSVSLVGEDRDLTTIDGSGTGTVISITANNVNIKGFTIRGSGTLKYDSGIFAQQFGGNEISHNRIINNNDGIHFELSSGNVISDNIISSNNNDGIFLCLSSDQVSGNTITNNDDGIDLFMSTYNVISGNIISSNNNGIRIDSTRGGNVIYHNNFNNINQVKSESTNFWDYDSEGNYWSDYNGTDDDQDGIGETPYIINENNKDNYPLTGMFSDFRFTFDEETYHINVISNSTIADFRFGIGQETGNKIISFNATGEGGSVGFCRVMIPIELMNYSYIVLVGMEEIVPTRLDGTSETYDYLYFTYIQNSHTITIISSKTLYLYYELLDKYIRLETDLYDLNATYHELLNNYTDFLSNYNVFLINYGELEKSHQELNNSYQQLLNNYTDFLINYSDFLTDYNELQKSHQELNNSYYDFLKNYSVLLTNYGELQQSHQELLLDYSKKVNNIQNLMYIFAATTAIFIITTIYLSRSAHASKAKVFEEPRKKRTP